MKNTLIKSALLFMGSLLGTTGVFAQHIERSSYNNETQIRATGSVTLKPGFHVPSGKTVRIFTGASFVSFPAFAAMPNADQNYVSTTIYKKETTDGNISGWNAGEVNRSIQYLDGLGRPVQTVQAQASPGFKDIIQPVVYDGYGREVMKYNPYPAQTGTNGQFRPNAVSDQSNFFSSPTAGVKSTAFPYAETKYEASPLSRVLEQGAPGAPWQIAQGHTVRMSYESNAAGEVRQWRLTATGAVSDSTYYPGRLQKTVTKDENWVSSDLKAGTSEEFKDFEGKIVLKRSWETNVKSLSTYYIYDDFGNIVYVLPPSVNENGQALLAFQESDAVFDQYIYAYKYDQRNRVIEKKIAGKGWEHMVYNKLDQLVLTQDANQRNKTPKQWLFTKYDAFGKPVITGVYSDNADRAALQGTLNGQTVLWESRAPSAEYSNNAFPTSSIAAYLTVNYYDNYTYPLVLGSPNVATEVLAPKTTGLLTGTKVYKTDGTLPLTTTNYYDQEAQLTRSRAQNHLGGMDEVVNTYNFAGELTGSVRTHTALGSTTTIAMRYEHDHAGRKMATMQSINGQPEVVLSKLDYNELGQLNKKNLHSENGTAFLQNTEYAYNERGWLKSSLSGQFSMDLQYNTGTYPQFNGNISHQSWGAGASLPNVFTYQYDKLDRLINGSTTSGSIQMTEALSYDLMGNIQTLNRDGSGVKTYSYSGNKLLSISGGVTQTNYLYDTNGNAYKDGRTNVDLTYNHLNLPQTASKTGLNLSYIYDATGQKLKKTSNIDGTTDYIGSIHYKNSVIDFIQTEEGLARNNSGNYSYEYNLTDHLGNVRYTFNKHPTTGAIQTLQIDNYYAFGLRKSATGGTNKYLYNGKELQEELGQYDYGARFYDPAVGRWNVVDPMAEATVYQNPYAYGNNNPAVMVDPDGMLARYNWETGEYEDENGNPVNWQYAEHQNLSELQYENIDPEKKGRTVKNMPGSIIRKTKTGYSVSQLQQGDGGTAMSDLMELGFGFTPVGTVIDFANFLEGTDRSGTAMSWKWRMFGLVPIFSEFKLGTKLLKSGMNYTKSSMKYGQKMHEAYHAGKVGKEFVLPSKKRIDYLDIDNGIIYELKPFNPRSIKQGLSQLETYKKELEKMPRFKGIKWKTVLDVY